jgi:hypothetical protein
MGGGGSKPTPNTNPTYYPTLSPTQFITIYVGVTFVNFINDGNQYYVQLFDSRGRGWKTDALGYGSNGEFINSKSAYPPDYPRDYSMYIVHRARDDYPVSSRYPFPLDNHNQQLIVAWTDAQGNIFSDALGTWGDNSGIHCVFGTQPPPMFRIHSNFIFSPL